MMQQVVTHQGVVQVVGGQERDRVLAFEDASEHDASVIQANV